MTKCDEVPSDSGLAELALALELPVRWITDGQDVPTDVHIGGARILASLGRFAGAVSPSAVKSVA
jgi:flagellar biosynthesis protein FlhF